MIKLYHTKCRNILMIDFVDVLVNDNYKAMCIYWWVFLLMPGRVKKAWDKLFEEWNTLIEGDQSNVSLILVKDVSYMRNKIYLINIAVYALKVRYNDRAVTLLRKLGYDFKYRPDTYIQDCERVLKRSKTIVADLFRKESELKRLYPEDSNASKVTEQDYIDMVYAISKHGGTRLTLREMTASEFAAAYNSYNREMALAKQREIASKTPKRTNR